MFKTILVPTDGSPLSDKAIEAALNMAKLMNGKIIGMSVAEPYPFSPLYEGAVMAEAGDYENKMQDRAHSYVNKIEDAAKAAKVPCSTVVAQSFSPYEEIIKTAEKMQCDLILMASHGRKGLNKLFLGSETQKVLAHTNIPVLVYR